MVNNNNEFEKVDFLLNQLESNCLKKYCWIDVEVCCPAGENRGLLDSQRRLYPCRECSTFLINKKSLSIQIADLLYGCGPIIDFGELEEKVEILNDELSDLKEKLKSKENELERCEKDYDELYEKKEKLESKFEEVEKRLKNMT